MERFEHERKKSRALRPVRLAAAILLLALGGYAGARTVDWISDFVVEEKPLGDGNSEFTIKDGTGAVIDQSVLPSDTGFFVLEPEDGQPSQIIGVTPSDPPGGSGDDP